MMNKRGCDDDIMRTTVNVDARLLAEAKLFAAREHRSIGSVLDDALRLLLSQASDRPRPTSYELPTFEPSEPGLVPGVDLEDKELIVDLLGDNQASARP
jgi:hypothetical protein